MNAAAKNFRNTNATTNAPRVFKDKERTANELNHVKRNADVFEKLGGRADFVEGLLEGVRNIAIRSELANNSSEHYRVFTDAAFLQQRSEALRNMAYAFSAIMNPELPVEKRDEIIEHFGDRMNSTTFHFAETHDSDNSNWIEFKDSVQDATNLYAAVREACSTAVAEAEQAKVEELVSGKIVKSKPVSAKHHDTFWKLLKGHDFFYGYSDCSRTWNRGEQQRKQIEAIAARHPHFNKMWVALKDAEGSVATAEKAIKALRKGLK
jgi:hypothetical protein